MRQLEIPKSCVQDAMRFTKSHVRVCVHGIFSFWGSCPRNALPIPPAHFVRSPRGIQAFEKARSNEKKKVFGSLSGYREAIRLREWWASNWISVGLLQKHRSWTNITHTILHTTWPTRPDRDWAISLSQGSSNRTVWSQDQSSSLKGENNPHSESDIIVQSRRTTAATAHGFSKGSWVFWSYLAYRCPIAVWATCLTCWWVLMMPMCSLLTGPSPLGPFRFHRISSPMSYGMMVLLFIGMLFFLPEPTTQPAPPFIARRMNAKAPVHSFALNVQRFGFPLPVAGLGWWFEATGRTYQDLSSNHHSFNLLQDRFEEYQSQVYDVSPEGTQVPGCFWQHTVVHP